MKKIINLFLILILGTLVCVSSCKEVQQPLDETGIDYTNYVADYSIKVKNNTTKNLVAFKGAPSANNLLGGIPAGPGNEHCLKRDLSLFNVSGDFVLFIVTEEDYVNNIDNLSKLVNKPFTRLYAYYNQNAENHNVYEILDILGGDAFLTLYNTSGFNVELRVDGAVEGPALGYAGQGMTQTTFSVMAGDYLIYPVFRKFNKLRNEIITVYPNVGGDPRKPCYENESLVSGETKVLSTAKWLTDNTAFNSGCAYLSIRNKGDTGMCFYDGGEIKNTSTGSRIIGKGKTFFYQINMPKLSNTEYFTSYSFNSYAVGNAQVGLFPLPEFTYESNKIYEVSVDSKNGYDVTVSDIIEVGSIDFSNM